MSERTRFWVVCGAVIAAVGVLGFLLFGGDGAAPAMETAEPITAPAEDSGGDFAQGPAPLAESAAVSVESGLAGSRAAAGAARRDGAAKGSGRIIGLVRHRDGSPAAGAAVTARWKAIEASEHAGYDGGELRYSVTADMDGALTLSDLADGVYLLRATDGDFAGARAVPVRNGGLQETFITLSGSGRLAGQVLNDSGAPVAGAWVTAAVTWDGERTALRGDEGFGAETDAAGGFEVSGLPDGEWRLIAHAEGYAPSASEPVRPDREGIVLTLGTGGVIAGTVTDSETGEPVAGVKLRFEGEVFAAALVHAESGVDGRFLVALLAADTYTASIPEGPYRIAGGRMAVDVVAGETAERDLTVAVGGVVSGTVVRRPGKTPAGGVTVEALAWSAYDGVSGERRDSVAATGSDGAFLIEGLREDAYILMPSGPSVNGQLMQLRVHVPKGGRVENVEVVLPATGTVEGRVLDASGEPVEGAIVRGADGNTQSAHAVSDAQGRFVLRGMQRAAEANVYAVLGEMRSKVQGPLVFDGEGVARTELRLEAPATGAIEGRVIDPAGKGVGGASVITNTKTDYGRVYRNVTTGDDGSFAWEQLPAGFYQATAQKDGVGSIRRQEPIEVVAGRRVTHIELTLGSGETMDVSGVVVDANGRPAAGVRVLGQGQTTWSATTDARGAFTLTKVWGDSVQVTAAHEVLGVARQYLQPIQTGIALRLGPPDLLRGRVVDGATGRPITRFFIGMTWSDTLQESGGWERPYMVLFEDPEGRFAYDADGQSLRNLIAEAEGYATVLTPPVRDGETVISLTPGRRVTGRVVDGAGNGIAGAAVYMGKVPDQWTRMQIDTPLTDAEGAFVLTDVAPEAQLVSAAHAGFAAGSAAIPADGDAAGVTITLTRGAVLRLRTAAEGWPGDGARWANVSGGIDDQHMLFAEDGTATFEGLAPGEYVANAGWQGQADDVWIDRRWNVQAPVIVADGQTTEVDLVFPPMNAAVEGVITASGRPVARANVWFNQFELGGGGHFAFRTGADGGYRINPMPPGLFHVSVNTGDNAWSGQVTLMEGAGVRFDIDMDVPFVAGGEER